MWLFIRRITDLDEREREELISIRQASETAETLYLLVQQFLQMVRQLEGERLEAWLTAVAESQIEALQRKREKTKNYNATAKKSTKSWPNSLL